MFQSKLSATILPKEIENVVWVGKDDNEKRIMSQWMHPDFYADWTESMRDSFDILGMMDQYQDFVHERTGVRQPNIIGVERMEPVCGLKNKNLLRKATENMSKVSTSFEVIPLQGATVLTYTGKRNAALDEWSGLTELLGQTTVVTIVTPGLQYYIQGTQVGYDRATRHLFHRGNKVERVGNPHEPRWKANVSGFTIIIVGDWDEIKKTKRETGLKLFQMLQLRMNEELKVAIRQGG